MLVPGLSSAKRGVLLGEVVQVERDRVVVDLKTSIAPGDGIVFQGDRAGGTEQGGRVYEVFVGRRKQTQPVRDGAVALAFAHGAFDFSRLEPGLQVWKTDDPRHTARWRKTFTGEDPQRRVPVDLTVRVSPGELLTVEAKTSTGLSCVVESSQPAEVARKHSLTETTLREQLGRLGGTVYELQGLAAHIDGEVMLPLSVLNKVRQEVVARLDAEAEQKSRRSHAVASSLEELRKETAGKSAIPSASIHIQTDRQTALHVLCRSLDQLHDVLAANIRNIYVDFQDIREYREAAKATREQDAEVFLATPRIQKPDEYNLFKALAKHEPDGMLVRNLAGLQFCVERNIPAIADFSLNATNELAFDWLRQQGAQRVTASYDMNRQQLLDMVAAVPPSELEVVIHQHMPMFHMEHCVFCAVLSPGTNKHNCGRPCDFHEVHLRDHIGMEHRLTADVGCRNTLFNATPQSAAEAVPELLRSGVLHHRVELLDERGDEVRTVIDLYRELLSGEIRGRDVW